jgi:hypothetical protein
VLAAEHLLGFAGVDFRGELVQPLGEIGEHVLAGLDPLGQYGQVVGAALQGLAERDVPFDRLAALQRLLRRRLVFPEIGVGGLLLYLGELVGRLRGVKDSSADRMRAC